MAGGHGRYHSEDPLLVIRSWSQPAKQIGEIVTPIKHRRPSIRSLLLFQYYYFNVEIPVGRVGAGSEKRAISIDFMESCT
jgi:hypothetical protein